VPKFPPVDICIQSLLLLRLGKCWEYSFIIYMLIANSFSNTGNKLCFHFVGQDFNIMTEFYG
jgi:hypothetical protein